MTIAARLLLLSPLALFACSGGDNDSMSGFASASEVTTNVTSATSTASTDASTGDGSGSTSSSTSTSTWPDTTGSDPATTTTTGEPWTTSTTWPDTTTGDVPESGCDMYCVAMATSCVGEHSQYPTLDSCEGACAGLPPGAPGVTSGNSLSCRAYHAGMASIDPGLHCVHAGPGGAGACGQNCEGFCAIATATCPSEHPDFNACLVACGGFDDSEPYNVNNAEGDTLACRLYHLSIAATNEGEAEVHCPHTIADSPVCL